MHSQDKVGILVMPPQVVTITFTPAKGREKLLSAPSGPIFSKIYALHQKEVEGRNHQVVSQFRNTSAKTEAPYCQSFLLLLVNNDIVTKRKYWIFHLKKFMLWKKSKRGKKPFLPNYVNILIWGHQETLINFI